eukprot:CAMPEP_0196783022 /NCGR_PEP_ID=MMETSP1104-20130614/12297_1 /TAXON_ID=33652 /ORGANISM="Cafeteria sp., Strain Caron Lab Isolate" /LENGTH=312 /DNA_ID=CAMNT_0042153271 /DNA_START=31 /DNA_END=966 /DNA_ORIENTATION=-
MMKRRHRSVNDEEQTQFLLDESSVHASRKRHYSDLADDDDDFEFFTPLNIILVSLWSISLVLFTIWVATIVSERWDQMHSSVTSTAVRMRHVPSLQFPAITICNLAQDVPLRPVYCGAYNNASTCKPQHDGELTNCLVYNNDKSSIYAAERTGLADTLMIAVGVNINRYPPREPFSGVHINLHEPCDRAKDECPEELTSALMSAPGTPVFFRMTKVVNEYLNGTTHVHFEARDSDVGDHNFETVFGKANDTVVLGFHYMSMSEMVIKELPRYTWLSLGAEVGGIVGLLYGIGIVNVISGIIKSIFLGKSYVK